MAMVPSVRGWLHRRMLPLWILSACVVFLATACGSVPQTAASTGAPTGSQPAAHPGGTTSKPRAVPPPRSCHQWGCRARQTVNLTHGYALALWLGDDQLNYRSRPVVELLDGAWPCNGGSPRRATAGTAHSAAGPAGPNRTAT